MVMYNIDLRGGALPVRNDYKQSLRLGRVCAADFKLNPCNAWSPLEIESVSSDQTHTLNESILDGTEVITPFPLILESWHCPHH